MKSILPALLACTAGTIITMADTEFTVLTLNVRLDVASDAPHTWEARLPLITAFLGELEPDLIGLQEAQHHQLNGLLNENPEFASIGVGRDDGKTKGEYSALLYRKDEFVSLESGTFWLSDTPEKVASKTWGNQITRICTWSRFKITGTGENFYLYNTHFDHQSQEAREKSAMLILERIADRAHPEDSIIVTGDFNADESNPAITALTKTLSDTFRSANPDATDVGTFHGFTDKVRSDKIDYIFASGDFVTSKSTIHRPRPDGLYLTDHEPVSAILSLPSEP
jgi:endonuclease/exonuclease/phosphatase family metal-dependent hydrolase